MNTEAAFHLAVGTSGTAKDLARTVVFKDPVVASETRVNPACDGG